MMDQHSLWAWAIFHVFVLAMLALDLGVFHRRQHAVSVKEALAWTGVWVAVAMIFNAIILFWGDDLNLLAYDSNGNAMSRQRTAALFLTAYLVEKSLSMDNVFVFLIIFRYFAIPSEYQHKTLFWGILGALVMRLIFILAGVALLEHFHWVGYIFGAVLIFTGFRLWTQSDEQVQPERNPVLRLIRRVIPIQTDLAGGRFAVKHDGKWFATPLLVALLVIETTDVVFAIDSVPAVLGITRDPFIAYSSNVFAILGLRALYFALAGIMPLFKDLHYGLAFVLIFVGGKMIAGQIIHLPDWMHWVSLAVIGGTMLISTLTSIIRHKDEVDLDATV